MLHYDVYAHIQEQALVYFFQKHSRTHTLSHFTWVQIPLTALLRAAAQLGMDFAGHGPSGHWSHPRIEVMKEDSVPNPSLNHGQKRREGTQST